MGTASKIRAGAAYVEITTSNSALQKGLANAQARLRSFGAACSAIGREMMTLSAAVAAPLAIGVRVFAAFDDKMREVKAVTGSTGTAFAELTEQAKKLGRETSFTASQVAGSMASLGRMGFNAAEISAATPEVMNLSRATGTELAEAAQIASNNLRVFHMEAAQMSDVADIMTATANGSAQTLTDLGEALKTAGPRASEAGQSLKETCVQLGILANMGIRGSIAGNALARSFQQMTKSDVQSLLKSYGVAAVDGSGNLRKMRDIFADLARAAKDLPNAEKIELYQKIFDIRGSLGGGILTTNIEQMETMTRTLDQCAGVAERTAKEMDAGIGGAFRALASAAEGVGICIGELLQTSLIPLAKGLSDFLLTLRTVLHEHPAVTNALAAGTAGLAGLGGAMIAAGITARAFAGTLTILQGAVRATQTVFALLSVSNPLGWALLAAGAVTALAFACRNLGRETRQTSEAMKNALADGNAVRDMDKNRADRLAELARKQQLSNTETAEAKDLLAGLESRYGKFGASLDTVSGKLNLAAEAQQRLNNAMREKAVADIDKAIAEHRQNIEIAKGYNRDMTDNSQWYNPLNWGDTIANLWGGGNAARIENNGKYIIGQWDEIAKLQAQKRALMPPTGTVTQKTASGTSAAGNGYLSPDDRLKAEQEVAEYQRKLERERRTSLQNEIADIKAAANDYKKMLEALLKHEQSRPARLQDAGKIDRYKRRIAAVDTETDERISRARQGEIGQYQSRMQETIADMRQQSAERRQMQNNPASAVAMLAGLIKQYQSEAAAAMSKYQSELAAARQGGMTKDRRQVLDDSIEKYRKAGTLIEQFSARLAEARTATVTKINQQRAETLGAWSIRELSGMFSRNTSAERTAIAAEGILRQGYTLARYLEDISKKKATW